MKVNLHGKPAVTETKSIPVYSYPDFQAEQSLQCNPLLLIPTEHSTDIVPPESLTTNSPLKTFSV